MRLRKLLAVAVNSDRNPRIFAHKRRKRSEMVSSSWSVITVISSVIVSSLPTIVSPTPVKNATVAAAVDASVAAPARRCPPNCGNGGCDDETGNCLCNPGWRGRYCSQCGGKVRFNSTKGWLADAEGNYTIDSKCTWLIEAPDLGSTIRLHLKEFATECGWDHLYVFDGDSVFSDLRAVFSGLVRSDRYNVQRVPEVVGRSGRMLLHFYSDVAYNMTGFNVTFSVDSCPSDRHELTCSGHGSCDHESGSCICDDDFRGDACDVPACPKNCMQSDTGLLRGKCNPEAKRCDCFPGWTGEACAQRSDGGYLTPVHVQGGEAISSGRTSHSATVDEHGTIWVVGGETFSHNSRPIVFTLTVNVQQGRNPDSSIKAVWGKVPAMRNKGPSPRYGHTAVMHERKIYMYGGTMRSGHTSKELWAFDTRSHEWERVETVKGRCLGTMCGPVHSSGHAAVVQSNRMIVIFGYSPKYGYLKTVQEYHFKNKEWSMVPTSGYLVSGGYGHSAAWDDITKRVYVYGGYVSTSSAAASLSDKLYSYDPIARTWMLLSSGTGSRYLHSAVISLGVMIVFGGNTHNDTAWSYGAKCFSADVLLYDVACDRWRSMDHSTSSLDLPRFGHSTVITANGTVLIYGGFNGLLKNDVIAYIPGDCGSFTTRSDCLSKLEVGIKCIWKDGRCQPHPPNRLNHDGNVCLEEDEVLNRNNTEFCFGLDTCQGCTSTSKGCVWCRPGVCAWRSCQSKHQRAGRLSSDFSININNNKDDKVGMKLGNKGQKHHHNLYAGILRSEDCPTLLKHKACQANHLCHSCVTDPACGWYVGKTQKCWEARGEHSIPGLFLEAFLNKDRGDNNTAACTHACSKLRSCSECMRGRCLWCKNLNVCIDKNAYLASFPYGQCMDWTTHSESCPTSGKNGTRDDVCSGYQTCKWCNEDPACGWCDDGSGTGLGRCLVGGYSGPLEKKKSRFGHQWVPAETCQPTQSWYFTMCPDCQCNGHSSCGNGYGKKTTCRTPCNHNTGGKHCQLCSNGFFGNSVNGGRCKPCQCNGQATTCNHRSGKCNCTTKGIIGDQCQKCDKNNHYSGDPINGGSCFYDLAIDYQFTFNLSKPDDRHLTAINFKNAPTKLDVDVDFSVTCSVNAKLNLTVSYASGVTAAQSGFAGSERPSFRQEVVFSNQNCSVFKHRFSKDNFVFGHEENTTFYVRVYDFQTPIWIIISFSQHPKLDLLQFFITFSVCFLALLLAAAILWKIKQKYDRYRRRQRLFVEMEQMASRPFGTVLIELDKVSMDASRSSVLPQSSPSCVSPNTNDEQRGTNSSRQQKRRKPKHRPSPIALEPCFGNRAAILSLIVSLPTGGLSSAPEGTTGMAVASSLVTLGNPRKPSSETSSSKQCFDDQKSGLKGRKANSGFAADL